jgi:UDP-glucose:glycoprotein glucosyltransferase
MKSEMLLFSSFKKLGFSNEETLDLLIPESSAPTESMVFDTRSDSVAWLNNVEKDSRYKRFPDSLTALLRQVYPGQLYYIRKNVYNVVAFVDFSKPVHLVVVAMFMQFIEQSIPIRFGFVPLMDTSDFGSSCIFN